MEEKIPYQKYSETRLYYMDWLRAIGVHTVVWLHCMVTLDEMFKIKESNELIKQKMDSIVRYLVQFGIPTFFLLSGYGLSFYKTEKSSFFAFFLNKFNRLIVPFIACFFFLLIPKLYFQQIYSEYSRLDGGKTIQMNFFEYVPAILKENIETKISQFWFLIALMIVFMVNYPLLCWSRRRFQDDQIEIEDFKIIFWQISAVLIWSAICFIIIGHNKEDYWNYIMPSHIILLLTFGVFFVIQLYLQLYKYSNSRVFLLLLLVGPTCSLFINFFKYIPLNKIDMYGMQLQINFHIILTAQGVCNQLWTSQIQQETQNLRNSSFHPFFVGISFFLYGVLYPGNYTEVGYEFFFPIYGNIILNCLFTLGSWQITYFVDFIFWSETNKKFDERVYSIFSESSMFIYLCHDLWQVLVASYLVYPVFKGQKIDFFIFGSSYIVMVVLTESLSFLNCFLFDFIYNKIARRNGRKLEQLPFKNKVEPNNQQTNFGKQGQQKRRFQGNQQNYSNINNTLDDEKNQSFIKE